MSFIGAGNLILEANKFSVKQKTIILSVKHAIIKEKYEELTDEREPFLSFW